MTTIATIATIPHLAGTAEAEVMRMPTYDELEEALGPSLTEAHDRLEALSWRLDSIAGAHVRDRGPERLDRPPTFADLGAVWSFVEDLETDLFHLRGLVDRFKDTHLQMLDEYRREQQVASGVKAA